MIPLRRPDIFGEPRPMFATCDIGLESALAASLEEVGATDITPVQRGVGFVGDREVCWRINVQSRVASRVLVPIAEFAAADKVELLAGATEAPWSHWFQVSKTIAVDATSESSTLDHTGYIAQVVKDGVCDHFRATNGRRPDVDKKFPDIRINARIEKDRCIISLDSSGVSLDRRGYRREAGPAPLRETLAAACLFSSGWNPDKALVDPMCGAGTLLIEAALIATHTPPGLGRGRRGHFSFTHWYGHRINRFEALLDTLEAAIIEPAHTIFGSDVDSEVLGHALRNAERAGVADAITFAQQPISAACPPAGIDSGVLLCNPPYGHRIGRPDQLEALYATLGRTLKFEFGGWDVWLLIGEGAPARKLGMAPSHKVFLRNGPIECQLLQYEVFKGRPSLAAGREAREEKQPRGGDRGGPRRDDRGGPRRDDRGGPRRDDRGGPRRDDRGGPRRDDRGGPRRDDRDDRGGYRHNDRGGPRRDDRGGPRRDDRGGYRHNDRGGPRRDDRGGPGRDDRGGPRRDDRGGYRQNDRGGPRRDDRGGPRRDNHGGPRRDDRGGDRGGPRRDDRGGDRQNDRGGPRRDDRGGPRRDNHGGPRRDDRGGYGQNDRGGPRRDNRGGPGRDNRGGPRRDDRGGPRRDDRGGYRQNERGGPPRDDRGGPRRDDRGGYRQNDRGGPPRDNRGGPRSDNRGGPRSDHRGGPRSDNRGGPRSDNRGGPRSDHRGGPRSDNRGGPRSDSRGGPRSDNRGGPRSDNRGGPRHNDRSGPRRDDRSGARGETRRDDRSRNDRPQRPRNAPPPTKNMWRRQTAADDPPEEP